MKAAPSDQPSPSPSPAPGAASVGKTRSSAGEGTHGATLLQTALRRPSTNMHNGRCADSPLPRYAHLSPSTTLRRGRG